MSEPPHSPYGTIPCLSCGRKVPYTKNKSDGRIMARCTTYNPETGATCHFFRYLPGSRIAEPSNPSLHSQTQRRTTTELCTYPGCGRARNTACPSKRCRTHCIAAGGCNLRSHRNGETGPSTPSSSSQPLPNPPPPLPPPNPPPSSTPQHPLTPPPSQPPPPIDPALLEEEARTAQFLNPAPNPRYRSQIRPMTYESMAYNTQQEEQRLEVAAREREQKRVQSTVQLHVWRTATEDPDIISFQDNIGHGFFTLTRNLFSAVGLIDENFDAENELALCARLHCPTTGLWTLVGLNYSAVLPPSRILYLTPIAMGTPYAFDVYMHRAEGQTRPNIRTGLQAERHAVRTAVNNDELDAATAQKRRVPRTSSSPKSSSPKRRKRKQKRSSTTPRASSSRIYSPLSPNAASTSPTTPRTSSSLNWSPPSPDTAFTSHFASPISPISRPSRKVKPEPVSPTILRNQNTMGDVIDLTGTDSESDGGPAMRRQRWPAMFPITDVVNFFGTHRDWTESQLRRPFKDVFQCDLKIRTYRANEERWDSLLQHERDEAFASGALWKTLNGKKPLRDSALKSARRQAKRAASVSSVVSVSSDE